MPISRGQPCEVWAFHAPGTRSFGVPQDDNFESCRAQVYGTVLLIAVLLAQPVAADVPAKPDPAFEARLADIDARAGKIQDYTARFEQQKYTALLRKPLVSSGVVKVLGPIVRWDTDKPDPAVLHADGAEVKLYYPKQKLVEIYPIDKRMTDLASSPLPRLATLRDHFSFEPIASATMKADAGALADGDDRFAVRLRPTGEFLKQHLSEVRVLLDMKSAFMLCVVTVDKEGDRTVIRFSEARLNSGLKPADVAFAPPNDARVSRPLEVRR